MILSPKIMRLNYKTGWARGYAFGQGWLTGTLPWQKSPPNFSSYQNEVMKLELVTRPDEWKSGDPEEIHVLSRGAIDGIKAAWDKLNSYIGYI